MSALLKRIEVLEAQAYNAEDEQPMFIHLVGLGAVENTEITRIWQGNNGWDRKPDETEEAFKARAASEAFKAPNCKLVLMGA